MTDNVDSGIVPGCYNCLHVAFGNRGLACRAFPNGIPLPILSGELDHTKPIEGDGGIRWEYAGKDFREIPEGLSSVLPL